MVQRIENRIKQFVQDRDLLVLRDVRTHRALNVSYTETGLRWTLDSKGKLIFYKDARLGGRYLNGIWFPKIEGDTTHSKRVYVEPFIPRDHNNPRNQIAEIGTCDKALRLLYHVG